MNRILCQAAVVVVAVALPAAAAQQPSTVPQVRADLPRVVARASATRFAVIRGIATRPAKSGTPPSDTPVLSNVQVRLRDAGYGRLVATQLTDERGNFVFQSVEPGNYLVELVGSSQETSAVTQLINANAGDIIDAVVRLPNVSALAALAPLALIIAQAVPAVVSVAPPASER